jgi:Domain of unknown function (DUF4386)
MLETDVDFPRKWARISGLFYLGTIIAGVSAQGLVLGSIVVRGDATATAANISAHPTVYAATLACDLIMLICYVIVTALFYELFARVDRSLSRMAAGFSMIGIAVFAVVGLLLALPPLLEADVSWLSAFTAEQRHSLAYLSLALHGNGYGISLVFFGVYCVLIGVLIWRCDFLPRWIGVLMAIAGVCYLVSSFAQILAPGFAHMLGPVILVPGLVGEGSLSLWLIFFAKWQYRTSL